MTTNGQSPFVTVFMYLNEAKNPQEKKDLAMIIEEMLLQRCEGRQERGRRVDHARVPQAHLRPGGGQRPGGHTLLVPDWPCLRHSGRSSTSAWSSATGPSCAATTDSRAPSPMLRPFCGSTAHWPASRRASPLTSSCTADTPPSPLGYAGLYECVKYMTGHSHTDAEATPLPCRSCSI